jgi:hypothetical protein
MLVPSRNHLSAGIVFSLAFTAQSTARADQPLIEPYEGQFEFSYEAGSWCAFGVDIEGETSGAIHWLTRHDGTFVGLEDLYAQRLVYTNIDTAATVSIDGRYRVELDWEPFRYKITFREEVRGGDGEVIDVAAGQELYTSGPPTFTPNATHFEALCEVLAQ